MMSVDMNFASWVDMMMLIRSSMVSTLDVEVPQSISTPICSVLNVSLVKFVSTFCGLMLHTIIVYAMLFPMLAGMICWLTKCRVFALVFLTGIPCASRPISLSK